MRTGLLLSRDDGAISQTVDVDALCRDFSHLAVAKVYDTFFSAAAQRDILDTVSQGELDSVVLGGNSPKYFERIGVFAPHGSVTLCFLVTSQ
jgi:heterodisulfide reductase subunit A-like polyferredoxin